MADHDERATGSDPEETARRAGLRYVSDDEPGIRRRRCGRGFTYVDASGKTVRTDSIRERITELVIPPAWQDVWICRHRDGHIQATGRDQEGRKQYLYHPRWRAVRDREKYRRLGDLGRRLPRLRRRVGRDLNREGLDRERIVAGAVRLLDRTALRVGSEAYAEDNESFGITTLRRDHVSVQGDRLRFRFTGKAGRALDVAVRDSRLARLVRDLHSVEAEPLFVFHNGVRNGSPDDPIQLRPEHVNEYLRHALESDVTAKDFRTWAGSVEVLLTLASSLDAHPDERDQRVLDAVDAAAELLGNLRSTAREYYVHPGLLRAYEVGVLAELIRAAGRERPRPGFRRGERLLLALLPGLDELMELEASFDDRA